MAVVIYDQTHWYKQYQYQNGKEISGIAHRHAAWGLITLNITSAVGALTNESQASNTAWQK